MLDLVVWGEGGLVFNDHIALKINFKHSELCKVILKLKLPGKIMFHNYNHFLILCITFIHSLKLGLYCSLLLRIGTVSHFSSY